MMMMLVTKKMNDAGITYKDFHGNLSHLLHIAHLLVVLQVSYNQ